MGDPVTMALTGAALNGGMSLVKGKGLGSSLKSAAIGGALGGAGGALGQAAGIGGGSAAAAAPLGSAPTTAAEFEAANGLPSTSFLSNGGDMNTFLNGTTKSMGLEQSADPSLLDKMKSFGDKYGTVDNLGGAVKMYASMPTPQRPQMPQAQSKVMAPTQLGQANPTPLDGLLMSINQSQDKYKQPRYTLLG